MVNAVGLNLSTSVEILKKYSDLKVDVKRCLEEMKAGMSENFLQLNSSKTEDIDIGTPHQLRSAHFSSVSFLGHNFSLSASVTNLGITFGSSMPPLGRTTATHSSSASRARAHKGSNMSKTALPGS